MSEVIVLFRIPTDRLTALMSTDGPDIAVFQSDEEAEKAVQDHPFVGSQDYELVEINI